ncbi:MAG TPA: four helix bundle protein [Pseudomonas sp.]|nr:four helix bundle protein [Pseudomonas sp.]
MDFEKSLVWHRSKHLAVEMYRAFAGCRDVEFRSQGTRAAVAVPSNSAEGMERRGKQEKAGCLRVAKAPCAELRTQLIIAGEIDYWPAELANDWITETRELSRLLAGLINKISN